MTKSELYSKLEEMKNVEHVEFGLHVMTNHRQSGERENGEVHTS